MGEGRWGLSTEIIIAGISFCGTFGGALLGVLKANQLTCYRMEQLEKKVDKHNHLVERMVAVEESTKSAHHRIDELKS
jgi:hypothetical protein